MKSDAVRKAELEARLADLGSKLRQIDEDLSEAQPKDWDDQATEREDDEVLEGIGEAGLQETRMIEAALDRLAAGEYGFCVICGVRIPEERLDVVPSTPFCREHAR